MKTTTKTIRIATLAATGLLIGLAASGVAAAGNTVRPPPPTKQMLGATAAVVDFCARADRAHSGRYDDIARRLLGVSDKAFVNARNSPEYRAAYQSINQVLGKMSAPEAVYNCSCVQ